MGAATPGLRAWEDKLESGREISPLDSACETGKVVFVVASAHEQEN